MKERSLKSLVISLMMVAAMLLQPMIPLVQLGLSSHLWRFESRVAQAEEGANHTIYLPVVTSPPGPPAFEIISPADGANISGMMYFALQSSDVESISSVTFMAGETVLGTDTTPADGLRTFLDASELAAGNVELSAMATGANGETSKSIMVNVVSNPPASGTVEEEGGVFASQIGSVITIPPGGAPDGTTVSVTEMTQEQITQQNGFDWEAMGVNFLGAQNIQSSADFSKPLGVASANFGPRVQPGQAVVNYQIMPDADGDGVDELIVVNTASVAPNDDVISDPIAQVYVTSITALSQFGRWQESNLSAPLSAPPGTLIEIKSSGFNPYSLNGNVAIFRSAVDNSELQVAGEVMVDSANPEKQIFRTAIPYFPQGVATLTLHNESTGSTSEPIDLLIEALPALTRPASEVFDEFFTKYLATQQDIRSDVKADTELGLEEAIGAYVEESIDGISQAEAAMAEAFQLIANEDVPDVEQYLDDAAKMIEVSGILTASSRFAAHSPDGCTPPVLDKQALANDFAGFIPFGTYIFGTGVSSGTVIEAAQNAATVAKLGKLSTIVGGVNTGLTAAGIASRLLGHVAESLQYAYDLSQGNCDDDPPPPPGPTGGGSGGGGGGGGGGNWTTGMGAAPPSGGSGYGGARGRSGLRHGKMTAGRYLVKLFSNGSSMPFTGMSDAGGYFYLPFIPQDEPFTAIAFDTMTGETRTFEGIGPATGDSVFMYFDFLSDDDTGTQIEIGQVVTGAITETGQLNFYRFDATAGQQVYFNLQAQENLNLLKWKLLDREANTIFDICLGCIEPGVRTLALGGAYTLIVGEANETLTGTYQFQLWDVPPPDEFSIAIGDVISDGLPGPGAGHIESPGVKDIYTFNASPGQQVFFDVQDQNDVGTINWNVVDAEGTEVFEDCLGCGDSGVYTLALGGTYTMTVGDDRDDETGTYRLQLWEVPAPDEFSIAIGDTVSDGVPGVGAGNIESPGVKDIYTFNATPGQQINFEVLSQTGVGGVNWRLVDQDETELFNICLGCGDPIIDTLALGGTYTIIVGSDINDGTGTYSFQISEP